MTKNRIFSHVIERSMNSFLVLEARVFFIIATILDKIT